MMSYRDLVNEFRSCPRDVQTNPKDGKEPLWFYAYEHNDAVYISCGRNHTPACNITSDRKLEPKKFDRMLDIHRRRENGDHVSAEATDASNNQSYWFGIFKELGL